MSARNGATRRTSIGAAAATTIMPAMQARAQGALEQRVVIITICSRDVTTPFVQAFERRHPGTRVEVQNRSTTAAVAFLRETRSSPPGLFWASAPDAFEVLKQNQLLAKPQIDTSGIPPRIGGGPTHDPDGNYFGFAVSGYGIMFNTRYVRANRLPVPRECAGRRHQRPRLPRLC